jgi:Aerotolerance regulator N-terminal
MNFLAPAWIGLAAGASLAVVAIHLIAWRLPRVVVFPTARFVPDEPARRAARTVRPSDLGLLALRVGIIMAGGLALARPRLDAKPGGTALVIAVERSSVGDTTALRDSLRALPAAERTTVIVFDTVATGASDIEDALRLASSGFSGNASFTTGLLAAVREARRLEGDYKSVSIALVSTLSRGLFDRATQGVRNTWDDSIRLVRLPIAARTPEPVQVEVRVTGDDPVAAAIRLADSHGLLRGATRVVRDNAMPDDSTWATGGRALVVWPRANTNDSGRVDGIHAEGATAIGHFVHAEAGDSGRVVARWVNGDAAAREIALGSGCVRTIGFDVPDVGDFVLSPSFQRLVSELVGPCGGRRVDGVVADSVIAALAAPPGLAVRASVPDESRAPNRLAAALMTLAILLGIVEMVTRRRAVWRSAELSA